MVDLSIGKLLTADEFAAHIGVSTKTAYQLMKVEDYVVQIGKKKYVCLEKFERHIMNCKGDDIND